MNEIKSLSMKPKLKAFNKSEMTSVDTSAEQKRDPEDGENATLVVSKVNAEIVKETIEDQPKKQTAALSDLDFSDFDESDTDTDDNTAIKPTIINSNVAVAEGKAISTSNSGKNDSDNDDDDLM